MRKMTASAIIQICGISLCSLLMISFAPAMAIDNEVSQDSDIVNENVICRKTIEHKPPITVRDDWRFSTTVLGYDSGHVQITVSCIQSGAFDCNEIGSVVFDDSLINSIGDISTCSVVQNGVNLVTAFDDNNVIYTVVFPQWGSSYGGNTFITFDLYATEKGMKTSPVISVMGEDITIPFSEPRSDESESESSEDLLRQIDALKEENLKLKAENYDLLNQKPNPDFNEDGAVTISDAVWLLRYISELSDS